MHWVELKYNFCPVRREKLQQEAANTGFKMEHLEKVYMLMDLLEDIVSFPQLKGALPASVRDFFIP